MHHTGVEMESARCCLDFKIAGQVAVLHQDTALKRLVPALDHALGHSVVRRTSDVLDVHLPSLKPRPHWSRPGIDGPISEHAVMPAT